MRMEHTQCVWAARPKTQTEFGVEVGGCTGLHSFCANVQTDRDALDVQTFGETVNEIVKLRCLTAPDVREGDMLYLHKPEPVGVLVVDGESFPDYGAGDYRVIGCSSGYFADPVRNPTVITARIVTK